MAYTVIKHKLKKQPLKYECLACGKTYTPLTPKHVFCWTCFKKNSKQLPTPKLKELDKQIDNTQLISRTLNDEEKSSIAYMLARFTPIKDIQETFKHEQQKLVNYESIKSIRDSKKWAAVIDHYRKDWLDHIQEVPIANKRVRLEAYQDMLEEGYKQKEFGIVKSALKGAQEEVEKIGATIGNNYNLTYINSMPDTELSKRRDELVNKIKYLTKTIEQKDENNIEVNTETIETEAEIHEQKP